jgi:hypothetical protein
MGINSRLAEGRTSDPFESLPPSRPFRKGNGLNQFLVPILLEPLIALV